MLFELDDEFELEFDGSSRSLRTPLPKPAAIEARLETIGAGAPLSLEGERLRLNRT